MARLGSMWKNNAPPPKNGSKYRPVNLGICKSTCGISFDFPPLYLINGFILSYFWTKIDVIFKQTKKRISYVLLQK